MVPCIKNVVGTADKQHPGSGMTMSEVVERLAEEYGWSESVPNLSGKLRRGSLRYSEVLELADVLGYDVI